MNTRRRIPGSIALLAAAGLCLVGAAVADNPLPTIRIEATMISKKVIGRSDIGVPLEEVTVTRRVSYADLDLATYSGATALKRRVESAARLACKQLDKLYPLEHAEAPGCIHKAVADADSQVKQAIDAAESAAKSQ